MKITTKIILGLLGGLILSGIVNYVQYRIYHKEPVIDTIIITTDETTYDTIWRIEYRDTTLNKPQPVRIDTVHDIRYYMDTVYFERGWVSLTSTTHGSLLSQDVGMQFSVPNYYQTRTITNTITNTIRNDLFFIHGGFDYSLNNNRLSPVAGVSYIWNKHRRIMSINYSFMDRRIELNAGFSLWR
jgi:hypothetical protein